MTPREAFDALLWSAALNSINSHRKRWPKPGALVERLPERHREALKELKSDDINDRADTFLPS